MLIFNIVMTLHEFNTQSLSFRSDALFEWGYYITSYRIGDITRVLYALNGFFAEENISVVNNRVLTVKAFSNHELSRRDRETIQLQKPYLLTVTGDTHAMA